jgi:hypothetical protein
MDQRFVGIASFKGLVSGLIKEIGEVKAELRFILDNKDASALAETVTRGLADARDNLSAIARSTRALEQISLEDRLCPVFFVLTKWAPGLLP